MSCASRDSGDSEGVRMRAFRPTSVYLLSACAIALVTLATAQAPRAEKHLGQILVTPLGPTDGGDFGPNTPGTKTAGLQEAINHARDVQRDVYIAGGGAKEAFKNPVVYMLQETLRIPWMQDFRLDGGQAVIQNNSGGDAIVFDSQMSCWYKFGLIVSASGGAVVRLRPESIGPDNFSVITASKFEFGALVGAGSVFPGEGAKGRGVGLLFDSEKGPIDSNEFLISELIACERGLVLGEGSTNNWIRSPFTHLCNTHIIVGAPGSTRARLNRIEAYIHSENTANCTGLVVHGQNNLFTLSFGNTDAQRNVVLEAAAANNIITCLNLPNGYTNNAKGTNRLILPQGDEILKPAVAE